MAGRKAILLIKTELLALLCPGELISGRASVRRTHLSGRVSFLIIRGRDVAATAAAAASAAVPAEVREQLRVVSLPDFGDVIRYRGGRINRNSFIPKFLL